MIDEVAVYPLDGIAHAALTSAGEKARSLILTCTTSPARRNGGPSEVDTFDHSSTKKLLPKPEA
jgi:hypothetical protein